ncbi:hypothetical protein SprV_0200770800 [Sparganum proliferum]
MRNPLSGWLDGTSHRQRLDEALSPSSSSSSSSSSSFCPLLLILYPLILILLLLLFSAAPLAKMAGATAAADKNASVENRWCQLRDTVQSTALAVLGRTCRQHQNWFDDSVAPISKLLAEENRLRKTYLNRPIDDNKAAFCCSRRLVQQRLRKMQEIWMARKTEEIQVYGDRSEWKNFFSAIKTVYGPPTKATAPLLSADVNTLLTEKTHILQTVQQISSGKAPGTDAIPDEIYKHGGPQLMDHLATPLQEMWRQGKFPQDFKDPTIAHLFKRKGNRQLCENHRGTSLLNIVGKSFARMLLNRLNNYLEQSFRPESPCGFRRIRGTAELTFAARQLQEKCQEMWAHLYSTFVDLTKAFDMVNREGLENHQQFGCSVRFIQIVRQLHHGMMARVTGNVAVSEALAVTNGVKQGCVLAPILFSLMFSTVLMDAYRDERPGVRIAYRTGGHLLNQRRMHFRSHISTGILQ